MIVAQVILGPHFRFSLRSLLLLVSLAAAVCWVYWIGWPWLKMVREESQFEKRIVQLKAGMSPFEADDLIGVHGIIVSNSDANHRPTDVSGYFWKNAIYIIYFFEFKPSTMECGSVKVLRLKPRPPECPSRKSDEHVAEFLLHVGEVLSGQKPAEPWMKWELIYADPPISPAIKNSHH